MCTLGETSLLSVFHDLHLYWGWRCALDIPSQHMTVPLRVPVRERYSLLDPVSRFTVHFVLEEGCFALTDTHSLAVEGGKEYPITKLALAESVGFSLMSLT